MAFITGGDIPSFVGGAGISRVGQVAVLDALGFTAYQVRQGRAREAGKRGSLR